MSVHSFVETIIPSFDVVVGAYASFSHVPQAELDVLHQMVSKVIDEIIDRIRHFVCYLPEAQYNVVEWKKVWGGCMTIMVDADNRKHLWKNIILSLLL
jgi:hypothetical protein